jgi:hypothetical protein
MLLSPGILTVWFVGQEFPFNFTWILLAISLSLAPAAYPYYNIAVSNDRINGATKWGLAWERVEIKLEEIDTAKLLQPRFGKIFGITVIHSKTSEILTLGLNNQQLAGIVTPINKSYE